MERKAQMERKEKQQKRRKCPGPHWQLKTFHHSVTGGSSHQDLANMCHTLKTLCLSVSFRILQHETKDVH